VPGALDGFRILDFTHQLNGPYSTMLLGHLGAEIIKVEPPGGDHFRRSWMPEDASTDSYEFRMINTNKKSIVLDLKTERGIGLTRELVAVSDVMVENYAKGTMERFGLDYESARQINPRIIYACSRGYGEDGPYAAYGSNAGVNSGMAGWTHAAWQSSGAWGTKTQGIGDEAGGISLAVGILGALLARERTGAGQKVEVSMQEALLGFMVSKLHQHFTGNSVGGSAPPQVADGYFTLRAPEMNDEAWARLAALMENEDLRDDPRFATAIARRRHQRELNEALRTWARGKTRQELWEGLRDIGFFGAPVLSLGEVLEDPHIKGRRAFIEREHPTAGVQTLIAPWIRLSETPTSIESVSPTTGQHTDWVLQDVLGLSREDVAELRAEKIVQ
jgi:crotonobetainyl-CoA:carnitine CoA-transferase CaiB-like acyl-CoA transferase